MQNKFKNLLLIISVLSIEFTSQAFADDEFVSLDTISARNHSSGMIPPAGRTYNSNPKSDETTSAQEDPVDLIIQEQYKHNPKKFLYEKLIVEPTNKGCWLGFIAKLLPAIPVETWAIPQIKDLITGDYENYDGGGTKMDAIIPIGFKTVLASITYFLLHQFVSKPLSYRQNRLPAFLNFLSRWQTFKKYTPKELYPFFDIMYEKYKEGALTKEELTVTIPKSLEQIKKFISSK